MGLNGLDSCQDNKKTHFNRNNTPQLDLRIDVFLYSLKLISVQNVLTLFFHPRLPPLFFMGVFPLYGPFIFNPSLPLVNHVGDLLDACPIRNILEALWVVVNWDIFVQESFLHKCDQLVRCRTFNMVVAAFFPDISSFVVGYLPLSLSIKGMSAFCISFPGWLGSNLSQCFLEEA